MAKKKEEELVTKAASVPKAAGRAPAPEELHPSWAAKQSSKQEMAIQQFQGQKITFDDDDD